jgi:hypothetical protein
MMATSSCPSPTIPGVNQQADDFLYLPHAGGNWAAVPHTAAASTSLRGSSTNRQAVALARHWDIPRPKARFFFFDLSTSTIDSCGACDMIFLLVVLVAAAAFGIAFRRRYLSSISDIPGPYLASISVAWQLWRIVKGDIDRQCGKLHDKYGQYDTNRLRTRINHSHPNRVLCSNKSRRSQYLPSCRNSEDIDESARQGRSIRDIGSSFAGHPRLFGCSQIGTVLSLCRMSVSKHRCPPSTPEHMRKDPRT